MAETAGMTGVRKAAMLLVQMGPERSALVLGQLRDTEVEEITQEIVRLQNVKKDEADLVVDEFYDLLTASKHVGSGGVHFARATLAATLGPEKADEIMSRLSAALMELPFSFLQHADPRQLQSFLADEHPQTIALVLAHITADMASVILSTLPPTLQADVAHRVAVMDRTSPDIIKQVEKLLERKLSSVLTPTEMSTVGGLQPLVDIINRADRATERMILEGLEGRDPALANEIRSRMFMFEDIVGLDDKSIQQVLRQVEGNDLATALKGVSDAVRDKILRNLSERAAENLQEEIELLGPVRLRNVEEAQAKVVQAIRTLEEAGQIVVRRGDDEFVS